MKKIILNTVVKLSNTVIKENLKIIKEERNIMYSETEIKMKEKFFIKNSASRKAIKRILNQRKKPLCQEKYLKNETNILFFPFCEKSERIHHTSKSVL